MSSLQPDEIPRKLPSRTRVILPFCLEQAVRLFLPDFISSHLFFIVEKPNALEESVIQSMSAACTEYLHHFREIFERGTDELHQVIEDDSMSNASLAKELPTFDKWLELRRVTASEDMTFVRLSKTNACRAYVTYLLKTGQLFSWFEKNIPRSAPPALQACFDEQQLFGEMVRLAVKAFEDKPILQLMYPDASWVSMVEVERERTTLPLDFPIWFVHWDTTHSRRVTPTSLYPDDTLRKLPSRTDVILTRSLELTVRLFLPYFVSMHVTLDVETPNALEERVLKSISDMITDYLDHFRNRIEGSVASLNRTVGDGTESIASLAAGIATFDEFLDETETGDIVRSSKTSAWRTYVVYLVMTSRAFVLLNENARQSTPTAEREPFDGQQLFDVMARQAVKAFEDKKLLECVDPDAGWWGLVEVDRVRKSIPLNFKNWYMNWDIS